MHNRDPRWFLPSTDPKDQERAEAKSQAGIPTPQIEGTRMLPGLQPVPQTIGMYNSGDPKRALDFEKTAKINFRLAHSYWTSKYFPVTLRVLFNPSARSSSGVSQDMSIGAQYWQPPYLRSHHSCQKTIITKPEQKPWLMLREEWS